MSLLPAHAQVSELRLRELSAALGHPWQVVAENGETASSALVGLAAKTLRGHTLQRQTTALALHAAQPVARPDNSPELEAAEDALKEVLDLLKRAQAQEGSGMSSRRAWRGCVDAAVMRILAYNASAAARNAAL